MEQRREIEDFGFFNLPDQRGEERILVLIISFPQPLHLLQRQEGMDIHGVNMIEVVMDFALNLGELRDIVGEEAQLVHLFENDLHSLSLSQDGEEGPVYRFVLPEPVVDEVKGFQNGFLGPEVHPDPVGLAVGKQGHQLGRIPLEQDRVKETQLPVPDAEVLIDPAPFEVTPSPLKAGGL